MTEVQKAGAIVDGRRRLDRILAPGYLDDLSARSTDEIRSMRDECEEEECGVSFARRILQGKLDILRAEALRRRDAGEGDGDIRSLLDALPNILSDEVTARPLRSRVTRFLIPPSVRHHRREVERLAGEQVLSSLAHCPIEELTQYVQVLTGREQELSHLRRRLLDQLDVLQDELARRYRQGQADVAELLPRQP